MILLTSGFNADFSTFEVAFFSVHFVLLLAEVTATNIEESTNAFDTEQAYLDEIFRQLAALCRHLSLIQVTDYTSTELASRTPYDQYI
jgi:hypothetical protein